VDDEKHKVKERKVGKMYLEEDVPSDAGSLLPIYRRVEDVASRAVGRAICRVAGI
jgi:hypothetical protein